MVADVSVLRRCGAVLLAALLVAACKSPEEKLLDRRQALRASLDELYARYGSTDEARAGGDRGADRAEGTGAGLVRRFVEEIDRSQFDAYCLATGRGERAFTFSSRLEAFMREPANAKECRRAARIEAEVAALEREVATRREPGSPR